MNYVRHRNKIFIKVWALQKYLIQELAHQRYVKKCLADKISLALGSYFVVTIIKTDLTAHVTMKYNLMYFSELQHSKEVVKCFLVAVFRTLALQETVKRFLVSVQRT
jgi:hypothetical protein